MGHPGFVVGAEFKAIVGLRPSFSAHEARGTRPISSHLGVGFDLPCFEQEHYQNNQNYQQKCIQNQQHRHHLL
jgi:hypothetical protein